MIPKFLLKESIIAPAGFNRWKIPPASILIHMCLGSVYAWSVFNPALIKELGVVGSAAGDWNLSEVFRTFSIAIVCLGLTAAFAGKWLEKVGPRCMSVFAAFFWCGGILLASHGIQTHQIWLIWIGYGVLGGAGLGLGYVSPVSTLIRWFPDRRGMAAGLAIMGFGGGAMIAAPMKRWLLETFASSPKSLGSVDALTLVTEGGKRFVDSAEVIISDGQAYVVGTGNTGAAATFLVLGILYFVIMIISAFQYRVPAEGWKPKGWEPDNTTKASKLITQNHVHIDQALKTPQFYLMWIVLCFNVTAGIGVIGVAKTMIKDIFGTSLTDIVTDSFTTTYVLMISVFNMIGRFLWASLSDKIGRKNTHHCFFVIGTLLYLSIPFTADQVSANPSSLWLVIFYAVTMIIFTMYGGGFATIPAYLADIFGSKFVGGIHGRLLTAWSTAGVLGYLVVTKLRESSVNNAIDNLLTLIDPITFKETFGSGVENIQELVEAKTVTVSKLMEIAPEGTTDPTSGLYNTTMYTMAALLIIAFFANMMIKPVDKKHHMKQE